eukprot:XP_001695463.1 predicted protein [Chlamydomonas reinhardtii]
MFNALFAEEAGHAAPESKTDDGAEAGVGASTSTGANQWNLWSVATAVTNTVKARADELVKSVVDTDWKSELSTFSREVGEESKTLKEKTAELVEHLPEQVVHLPEKAEEVLQSATGQVQLPKDVGQTLGGVSAALSEFGKTLLMGTRELIDELREGVDTEIAAASREGKRAGRSKAAATSAAKLSGVQAKYNRFDAEVAAMQRDSSTYCDEPEDGEDYGRWRAGWRLEAVAADIARITGENAFMAELQSRLVPIIVEHEDFWSRYFYRLHKLQQKEEQRQQLAARAKTLQEDDVPLGWGDEDEAPAAPAPAAADAAAEQGGAAAAAAPAAVAASAKEANPASSSRAKKAASSEVPVPLPPSESKPAAAGPSSTGGAGTPPASGTPAKSVGGAPDSPQLPGGGAAGPSPEWDDSPARQAPAALAPAAKATADSDDEGESAKPASTSLGAAAAASGKEATASSAAVAKPAAAAGPKAGPTGGKDEEEVDEDWGNWD